MKTTFLALALAAASVPLTFANQANPPASANKDSKTATAANKKAHKKSHKKAVKKTATAKAAPAPMAAVPVKK